MDTLKPFSIPVQGLTEGIHLFDFKIDQSFFEAFEASMVKEGKFDIQLEFDKRSDMYVLTFKITGTAKAICDRCLEDINLPIQNEHVLIVKFSEEISSDDPDVIFIAPSESSLNVARFIYEYVNLSLPITKMYDCEDDDNAPCNDEMLNYLYKEQPSEEDEKTSSDSIWNELKNNFKNN